MRGIEMSMKEKKKETAVIIVGTESIEEARKGGDLVNVVKFREMTVNIIVTVNYFLIKDN